MRAHGPQLLTAMISGLDDGDGPHSLVALEAMAGLAKLLGLVEPEDLRAVLLHTAIRIRPFFDSVGGRGRGGNPLPARHLLPALLPLEPPLLPHLLPGSPWLPPRVWMWSGRPNVLLAWSHLCSRYPPVRPLAAGQHPQHKDKDVEGKGPGLGAVVGRAESARG